MASGITTVVTVEIQGQQFPIRTSLDAAYVQRLAAHVDDQIQKVSRSAPTADTLSLAILAALNVTDEFFRARDDHDEAHSTLAERAMALEHLVDEALAHGSSSVE
ncbi:MAG: cell division protein ZapA [Acidobacteria bacterium]|nr:cell division protein ZapA [Acidobacteriota bacterium]